MNFSVEHHCPSCGGPVFLDEADRFFVCPYCRVRSCIAQKGFGRYFISPHTDLPEDVNLLFLPYWRFKGVQYACTEAGVDHWFTDVSCLARPKVPALPFSLGFRSQAMELRRVSARTPGRFLRPHPLKTSLNALGSRSKSARNAAIKEDIGETISLIYAPFYLDKGQLFDAVLNTPLGNAGPLAEVTDQDLCRPERETRILSGLCPGCGWDLEGQSDALALICRNCDSLWQPRQNRLARIRFGSVRPDAPEDVLIPFWKISAQVRGMDLNSRLDLMKMANLPGADHPRTEDSELFFWAPAFKIRPKVFLRLARQFTIAQPTADLEKTMGKNPHLPVTLPASEAVQSIRITLASLARPLRDYLPQLAETVIKPHFVSLVFLPFESHPQEFIHRPMNLAINANLIQLSGNL